MGVEDVLNGAVVLAKAAQEVGLTNWWGWYVVAIVDATADLVTDVVSEVADDLHAWVGDVQRILTEAITEAADGSIEYIGDVAEDITGWINDAAVDAEDISDGTYCFERHCPQNEQ